VTINTCLNELKAEKIRPEWRWADLSEEHQHVLETLSAVEDESPEHAFDAKALLKRLLAELNPKDRLVIQLLHIEEKSVAEIAEITGWTRPVIKVRAFRARKKLQDRLQTLEGESSKRLLSPSRR
jgi:RNA polymerase sigma-70 factor (ECF subfamily)